jgi:hypothetical protein
MAETLVHEQNERDVKTHHMILQNTLYADAPVSIELQDQTGIRVIAHAACLTQIKDNNAEEIP